MNVSMAGTKQPAVIIITPFEIHRADCFVVPPRNDGAGLTAPSANNAHRSIMIYQYKSATQGCLIDIQMLST